MITVKIQGSSYKLFGKVQGSNSNKWNRATKLGYRFNEIDEKLRNIAARKNDSEAKRCALAVLLMMHTGIRVGNEDSAKGYMTKPHKFSNKAPEFVQTYGLTTLTKKHITFGPHAAHLKFIGKKQIENKFRITDSFLVAALRRLVKLDGDTLFGVSDYMINKFIGRHVGHEFTAKDFRCMKANLYAWEIANNVKWDSITKKGELRRQIKSIFDYVSERLNNTPAVCRKSYVHDALPVYLETTYSTHN